MCNCDNCKGAEYCEAHDKEFEEVQKAVDELEERESELTQEEVDAGLGAFDDNDGPVDDDNGNETAVDSDDDNIVCVEDTPKERLYREITDLSEKIDKLESYLKRRNEDGVRLIVAAKLTDAQVYLLHKQLEVMNEYYNILCSRYSIFDVRKSEGAQGITSDVEIIKE